MKNIENKITRRNMFNELRSMKNIAIDCATNHGWSVAKITIHNMEGFVTAMLYGNMVSATSYNNLSSWVHKLNNYIMENFPYEVEK